MNAMDITKEDMVKYERCKENLHRCKYVGIAECDLCEYDLSVDKIGYINS